MQSVAVVSLVVAAIAGVSASSVSVERNETVGLLAASCLAPEYHFDFPGNDLMSVARTSFDQCCDACYEIQQCGAYTWTNYNGGTCWLKSSRSRSEWKGANADGSANTISVEMSRCGKPITKDQDLIGLDGGSSSGGQHKESCCHQCANFRGCKGFAWTDYNGGTCWFKGGTIQTVYKPGVYSLVFGA